MYKKHILYTFLLAIVASMLTACGPDNKHIKITGHLLNLNQGEFLVYSPDGAMPDIDTIYVEGGRFTFEPRCDHDGSIVVVLPNNREIPVFVNPGESYSIDGDAHNMKGVKVKGGKSNDLMNAFRKQIADMPDTYIPEKEIKAFVEDNATSPVGIYLVRYYMINRSKPDYSAAAKILATMRKAQADNTALGVLQAEVTDLMNASAGATIPSFTAIDFKGNTFTDSNMANGVAIFVSYASWDYESSSTINRIIGLRNELHTDWKIVILSFDADKSRCRNYAFLDKSGDHIAYDGLMAESPLAKKLGVAQTGVVIVTKDGKITERNKSGEELFSYLRTLK